MALELLTQTRAKQIDLHIHIPHCGHRGRGRQWPAGRSPDQPAANAIAYTPAQGTVTGSAAGDSVGWSISVEDNGPGLPAEERDALGQRYRRRSQATAGGAGLGLGLGLAIARSTADRHSGSLRLQARAEAPGLLAILWWPRA